MRKFLFISSIVFATISIVFAIFPLGTISFLPVSLAMILSFLTIQKSSNSHKKLPKMILFVTILTFLVVIGKVVFIKDIVIHDNQFEKNKIEQKKEDLKDLENM